jgi:hypothetical protein
VQQENLKAVGLESMRELKPFNPRWTKPYLEVRLCWGWFVFAFTYPFKGITKMHFSKKEIWTA